MGEIDPGDIFSPDHFEMIMEATQQRQEKFPDEPTSLSMVFVMMNIGDRYSRVECREQEWTGVKADVTLRDGKPSCPNGHDIFVTEQVKLGWVGEKLTETSE